MRLICEWVNQLVFRGSLPECYVKDAGLLRWDVQSQKEAIDLALDTHLAVVHANHRSTIGTEIGKLRRKLWFGEKDTVHESHVDRTRFERVIECPGDNVLQS